TISLQHELPASMVLEAAYIGKKGTHLFWGGANEVNLISPTAAQGYMTGNATFWNATVPNPFSGIITDPNSSLSAATVARYQLSRPFPQYTAFTGNNPPWAN